jgi:hypothetical protein
MLYSVVRAQTNSITSAYSGGEEVMGQLIGAVVKGPSSPTLITNHQTTVVGPTVHQCLPQAGQLKLHAFALRASLMLPRGATVAKNLTHRQIR